MSHHNQQQKPMNDKRKPMTDEKNKPQQPMPRAPERDRQDVPGERSDKESIGQPVQLDPERQ